MDEARALLLVEELNELTEERVALLVSYGRVKAEAITRYRDAILASEEPTITGKQRYAETASSALDAQAIVLDCELRANQAQLDRVTITVQALA